MDLVVPTRLVEDSSLQVRWCPTRTEQDRIARMARAGQKSFVLLVGVHEKTSEQIRCLVPVEDVFKYVVFPRPGAWSLSGFVMWEEDQKTRPFKSARRLLEERHLTRNWLGYTYSPPFGVSSIESEPVVLEVPEEAFAAEPPKWEKRWVLALWKSPVKDQCDYRKRRVFAYTIQPLLFLAAGIFALTALMAARLVATALLLATGFYNLRWKYVLHPFSWPDHIWQYQVHDGDNFYANGVRAFRDWRNSRISPEEQAAIREKKETARRERAEALRLQMLKEMEAIFACDVPLNQLPLPRGRRIILVFAGVRNRVCRPMMQR